MTLRARMRSAATVVLGLLMLAPASRADIAGAGTRAASFLSQGSTPAVLGMGGAALGLARDLDGAGLNTAALGWLSGTQVAAAHAQLDDQTAHEWAAVAGRLGGGLTRFGLSAQYRDDGEIVGRDASNRPTGNFAAASMAVTAQLARPLGAHATMGAAVKYVGERVGDEGGVGVAFDAGVQMRFGMLGLGLAGQNFGGGMQWQGVRWPMPASLGAGIALDHEASGLRWALDVNAPSNYRRDVRVGTEWRVHDRFAVRGGWREVLGAASDERLGGPSFGLGLRAGSLWFDYAFLAADAGGGTHRIGLQLRPGRALGTAAPRPAARVTHPQPAPRDTHHQD